MMRRILTWKAALLMMIVALAATVGGLAYSTATGSSSKSAVKACYDPGVGSLRAVGSLAECKSSESPIDWSVVTQGSIFLPNSAVAFRAGHPGPVGP
jgi:hypothetical protein